MKSLFLLLAAAGLLLLLSACNEMPMETVDQGPAAYSADPTSYVPVREDPSPLHTQGR